MNQLKKALAKRGIDKIEPSARKKLGMLLRRDGVRKTVEFKRCRDLPRRVWTVEEALEVAAELTPYLAEPEGEMELWPIQALALKEMYEFGGLFAPIAVGEGKTLISFLSPTVMEAKRALLLIPASLREKTEREFKVLERHWWGRAAAIRIMHYEKLSSEYGERELLERKPDLIVADECHRLKNPRAACTKRMIRFMDEHPDTTFVAMSGTVTVRSLKDYAHILEWCLPKHCPLPVKWNVLVEWCQAVDEKVNTRMAPGALEELYGDEERTQAYRDELAAVRSAVRRRVTETPGVIATSESQVSASLRLDHVAPPYPSEVERMFEEMRASWETPMGEPIPDPPSMWRHAQELALGFVYRWDPPAPPEWLEKRKIWAKCCRHILQHNQKRLDSELPVINAVLRGEYDGKLLYADGFPIADKPVDEVLAEWRAIKPTFEPNTVPVWYHEVALDFAAEWMEKHKGLCWVEHRAFGQKLAAHTGRPFFANKGYDSKGRFIEDWRPKDGSVIVSIGSNKDGRNLQRWNRGLVMAPPSNGLAWEQMLGRMHRRGQEADEVTYTTYLGCVEMLDAVWQSICDAKNIEAGQQKQKLLYVDMLIDFDSAEFARGPRWVKG